MLQAKLMFAALLICISGLPVNFWLCGGEQECHCDSKRLVTCDSIRQAPRFTTRSKLGKTIIMGISNPDWFAVDTLERTYGFEHVMLTGANPELCETVRTDFPWITCIAEGSSTRDPTPATVARDPEPETTEDSSTRQETTWSQTERETTEAELDPSGRTQTTTDRQGKVSRDVTSIGVSFDYVTRRLQETVTMGGRTPSTERSWTVSELTFWGTVVGGSTGGLALLVIILIILVGRCLGKKKDPACLVKLTRACCDCCLCPVTSIGNIRKGTGYSKDDLECQSIGSGSSYEVFSQ